MAFEHKNGAEKSSAEEDEIYGENVFSGWRKNNSLVSDLMGNPFVWGCGVAFVLIVLLFILWPKSEDNDAIAKIETLSQKIEMIENRLFILESSFENVAIKPTSGNQPIKIVEDRIQQLEGVFNQRTENVNGALQVLTKRLTVLEERPMLSSAPAPAPAKPTEKKPVAPERVEKPKPAPAQNAARYYTVQQGDTLYSIGRKHELSVEKLVEINNIGKASPIVPGQKLKVTP